MANTAVVANETGTLIDLILARTSELETKTAFRFLAANGDDPSSLTYAALRTRVLAAAVRLADRYAPGSVILLALPTSAAAVVAVLGAVCAGLEPAFMPPPGHPGDNRGLRRFAGVLRRTRDAGVCLTAAGKAELVRAGGDLAAMAADAFVVDDELGGEPALAARWRHPEIDAGGTAYVQYTSGSTGAPRGVRLSHTNVLSNSELIRRVFRHDRDLVALSWLPLHHDMGLIGHVLQPLYVGGTSILAPTAWFSGDPLRWLKAIDRFGVVTSGAPPFAYDLCLRHLGRTPPAAGELDLSRWRTAYVGAEPVWARLLDEFATRFAAYGLRRDALLPCYGLAESTLLVAGTRTTDGDRAGRPAYEIVPPVAVLIGDPETSAPCEPGTEGEILLAGPSVASEYHGDPAATAETVRAVGGTVWLRTGDLGHLDGDRLTVTGRLKDVIVARGANVHAVDVEEAARAADPRLRHEAIAAVALPGPDTERLAVAAEVKLPVGPRAQAELDLLRDAIAQAIVASLGIVPERVLLVRRGSLARTTSGKIARAAVREAVLDGRLDDLREAAPAAARGDRAGAGEAVAIVGLACRFPQSDDPEAFWRHLAAGDDLIREVPPERWAVADYYDPRMALPGKMNSRWGGFIDGADRFDADFFGIAAHEAVEMDPQQRLLLEVCWRAFEHAGLPAERLAGSATGVFVGISTNDYMQLQIKQSGIERFNAYSGLGSATSIAANRLSYAFDLRGPSVAVDTACSSSLTAMHLAVQSLRNRECAQAVAGGVSLILSPGTTVALSQFGMLAPDGRCKVFDESADGYVRSEGCGLVVLKRLADARRDGDRVLAVIRGTAIAQDGRTPGITAPNPAAQANVIRMALADAACDPGAVTFVEAHGTGTHVGDPVEMLEIKRAYGLATGSRCYVGSVKANTGHLEAAAGVTSVVKMVQALRRGAIPPQLHVRDLNHRIELPGSRLRIPAELTPWRAAGARRVGAVSSFGFGGAIAHMIFEEPDAEAPAGDAPGPWLVPLSAHDEESLGMYVRDLRDRLSGPDAPAAADVAYTLGRRRTHFAVRSFVVAADTDALVRELDGWAAGPRGRVESAGVALLFSGQGSQFGGMGRVLYERFAAFRAAFDRCAAAFAAEVPEAGDLAGIVFANDDARLETTALLQPALFAVEYATAALLADFGITPAAVIGHSLGEFTAACVAGCLTVEEAMALVAARGRLMAGIAEPGAMAGVALGAGEMERLLDEWRLDRLTVAAVNAADSVVISGPEPSVAEALDRLDAGRVPARRLRTPQAFHSALMDSIADDFAAVAARVAWQPPTLPLVSNVTGEVLAAAPDAEYWRRHLRGCVRFHAGMQTIAALGIRHLVEAGPGETLLQLARRAGSHGAVPVCLPTVGRAGSGAEALLSSVGRLYQDGIAPAWEAVQGDPPDVAAARRPLGELPGHPYRRNRYWFTPDAPAAAPPPAAARKVPSDAGWVYDVAWRDAPVPAGQPAGDADRSWLIVGEGRGAGSALAAQLARTHRFVYHVAGGREPGRGRLFERSFDRATGVTQLSVAALASTAALSAAFGEILHRLAPAQAERWTVIYVGELDAAPTRELTAATLEAEQRDLGPGVLMALTQAVLWTALAIRVWIVTAGAQDTGGADASEMAVSQSTAWGFGATLFLEHPEMRGGMIDLAPDTAPLDAAAQVLAAAGSLDGEAFAAFRDGKRLAPRLTRDAPPRNEAPRLSRDGSYVVTGGLGGLGLVTARWLAERGAGRVVLLGRTALIDRSEWDAAGVPPETRARIDAIRAVERCGAAVDVVAADVTDRARLEQLFAELDGAGQPVRGVVHAAGENWYERIAELDADRLLATMRAKVSAAWVLHELTEGRPLDLFILYSSVSALWGSVNLAHYTAANAFLDALAAHRRRLGLPALCVSWGPWAEVGMSAKPAQVALMDMLGLRLLDPDRAVAAMEAVLQAGAARRVIADIDWPKFQAFVNFSTSPAFFSAAGANLAAPAVSALARDRFGDAIRSDEPNAALAAVVAVVRRELAAVLLVAPGREPGIDERFNLMGMDSLMAIGFALRLETVAGAKLPMTLAYNYPTILDVARHIFELVRGEAAPARLDDVATPAPRASNGVRSNGVLIPGADERGLWFPRAAAATSRLELPDLLCLPYAGGGASFYGDWDARLRDVANVIAVQPPGHEERAAEPPAQDMASLVGALCDAFAARIRGAAAPRFALFGHSLGGLVAFALALELRRRKLPLPELLALSACGAPAERAAGGPPPLHGLSDGELRERIADTYAIPPDVVRQDHVWAALAPVLRADLRILETYRPAAEPPLDIPFVVLGARADRIVSPDRLIAWERWAANTFALHVLPGGHMMIRDNAAAVDAILRDALAPLAAPVVA